MRKCATLMGHITSQLYDLGLVPVVPLFVYSSLRYVVIQQSHAETLSIMTRLTNPSCKLFNPNLLSPFFVPCSKPAVS